MVKPGTSNEAVEWSDYRRIHIKAADCRFVQVDT